MTNDDNNVSIIVSISNEETQVTTNFISRISHYIFTLPVCLETWDLHQTLIHMSLQHMESIYQHRWTVLPCHSQILLQTPAHSENLLFHSFLTEYLMNTGCKLLEGQQWSLTLLRIHAIQTTVQGHCACEPINNSLLPAIQIPWWETGVHCDHCCLHQRTNTLFTLCISHGNQEAGIVSWIGLR